MKLNKDVQLSSALYPLTTILSNIDLIELIIMVRRIASASRDVIGSVLHSHCMCFTGSAMMQDAVENQRSIVFFLWKRRIWSGDTAPAN